MGGQENSCRQLQHQIWVPPTMSDYHAYNIINLHVLHAKLFGIYTNLDTAPTRGWHIHNEVPFSKLSLFGNNAKTADMQFENRWSGKWPAIRMFEAVPLYLLANFRKQRSYKPSVKSSLNPSTTYDTWAWSGWKQSSRANWSGHKGVTVGTEGQPTLKTTLMTVYNEQLSRRVNNKRSKFKIAGWLNNQYM